MKEGVELGMIGKGDEETLSVLNSGQRERNSKNGFTLSSANRSKSSKV